MIEKIIDGVRVLMILAALGCSACLSISSNSPPSSNTTCTTDSNGNQACTSQPTGGSHWSFFL